MIYPKGSENMLNENTLAPAFHLSDQNGNSVSLADFAEQKIVLYFYPKDDTPGCTTQACSYRDQSDEFVKRNVKVIGISKDDLKSHQKFTSKYDLNFTLLSDPDTLVIQKYGVWKEKTLYGKTYMGVARTTFIIDETGTIVKIFDNVDPKNDVQKVLDFLDQMK